MRQQGRPSLNDPWASAIVDDALTDLAGDLGAHDRTLPGIVLVTVDIGSIRVRLASPQAGPPAPWVASANGTIWERPTAGIREGRPATSGRHGATGLMTAGSAAGVLTLIDFSEAHGLVGLDGNEGDRADAADRWVEDFSRNPWSRGLPILRVGGDGAPAADIGSTVTIEELIDAVTRGAGLAIVDEPLGFPAGRSLRRALESPGCRWTVLDLAGADGARWRFEVRPDGSVTSPVFTVDVPVLAIAGPETPR